jgi:hypothetical protein
MSTATAKRPIQLHYEGGQVVVIPEDQDRFVIASQYAVGACQNQLAADRFVDQFSSQFLRSLADWCQVHQSQVQACYVPFPLARGCVKVFMVSKSPKFDFVLSDAIADLELNLSGLGWPCDILQIRSGGPEELRAFFAPEQSIQVCGDGNANPAPAEG